MVPPTPLRSPDQEGLRDDSIIALWLVHRFAQLRFIGLASAFGPRTVRRALGCMVVLIGAFFAMGACVTILVATNDKKPAGNGSDTNAAPPPDPSEPSTIVGNGTFNLGGVDGKNWGAYEATATGNCQWSIRSVARYRSGLILDSGSAAPGEKVTVNIQADGDVSAVSGEIDDDHRLVFMTNGCGTWRTN